LRTIALAVCSALLVLAGTPAPGAAEPQSEAPQAADSAPLERLLGHWQRGKGEAIIEITEREGVYRGVIVWSQKRPETVGIEVFRGLRYDAEDEEWHGRAFSIKREREVPIDVRLLDDNQLELTAHILIFTKDVEFTRVSRSKLAALRAKKGL
jgi:hypothetical protein